MRRKHDQTTMLQLHALLVPALVLPSLSAASCGPEDGAFDTTISPVIMRVARPSAHRRPTNPSFCALESPEQLLAYGGQGGPMDIIASAWIR
jgi:hypothetical protein